MNLDIDIEGWPENGPEDGPESGPMDGPESQWPENQWATLAERACIAAAAAAPELGNPRLLTSILFTSDEEVHRLNREWRQKDKPTNVLSFPMQDRADLLDLLSANAGDGAGEPPSELPPIPLGDLALAYETCTREAEEKSIPIAHHTAHLIIHGLLHLAGYDHETSPEDANAMEALEIAALASMGVENPYHDQ